MCASRRRRVAQNSADRSLEKNVHATLLYTVRTTQSCSWVARIVDEQTRKTAGSAQRAAHLRGAVRAPILISSSSTQHIHAPHLLRHLLCLQWRIPHRLHRLSLQLCQRDDRLRPRHRRPQQPDALPTSPPLHPNVSRQPRRHFLDDGLHSQVSDRFSSLSFNPRSYGRSAPRRPPCTRGVPTEFSHRALRWSGGE